MKRRKYLYLISFQLIFAAGLVFGAARRPTVRSDIIPPERELKLVQPGVQGAIPYKKFGEFENVGEKKYRYAISDKRGLAKAAGEGVFPSRDVYNNPQYRQLKKEGQLEGNHWNFVDTRESTRNFYKWATTSEDPGVRQFYEGIMLERTGLIEQAIKAFYAVVVHFPKTVSITYYQTPWYVGPVSMDRVEQLLRRNTDIKMELEPGEFRMDGIFDNDKRNDVIRIDPGTLKSVRRRKKRKSVNLAGQKPVRVIGGPRIELKEYKGGRWMLFVDGKWFPIRAVSYSVTPVGLSPDRGTWNVAKDWQFLDTNENGIHDGFFESFVDKNGNNKQDADEPTVGDAKLLKDLGANTLRAYHHLYNKDLFRKLHNDYGFYFLVGDLLGGYATGSGASWSEGTDYRNPDHRKNMLESVRSMVEEYKDEPYVLMWVLGNENVYGVANNSNQNPDVFFEFVNEAAKLVKKLDPSRPVAYANGDLLFLDIFADKCPDVDVFGANMYRGEQGFGRHAFRTVQRLTGKPMIVTEYGDSAIAEGYTDEEAEAYQAMYLANSWEDLEAHMAGSGVGNVLGGVLFEFVDEWWKANSDLPDYIQKSRPEWYGARSAQYKNLQPENHDKLPQFGLPFLDGWSYEEWFGLAHIGNGENSPFVRNLRPAYFTIKKMWNKK